MPGCQAGRRTGPARLAEHPAILVRMPERFGPNAPCGCGSGLKFKNCCGKDGGTPFQLGMGLPNADVQAFLAAKEGVGAQHGTLVPSVLHMGYRFRAIASTLYWRSPKQTFHEFLLEVVKETVGKPWYMGQVGLPEEKRHHILRWFKSHSERSRTVIGNDLYRDGEAWGAAPLGDDLALLALGYDLIHLRHQRALPRRLIDRLTSKRGFQGALYEIAIAATFVRAGFKVEFLNSNPKKHPEFVATDPGTLVEIEVEAKSRHRPGILHQPGEVDEARALRGDVEHLVNDGLTQASGSRPFMLFVHVNTPPAVGTPMHEQAWFQDVWAAMQAVGEPSAGRPDDFNGLIFTNFPFHWQGAKVATLDPPLFVISQFPKFKLPDALVARVVKSIEDYGVIPREV